MKWRRTLSIWLAATAALGLLTVACGEDAGSREPTPTSTSATSTRPPAALDTPSADPAETASGGSVARCVTEDLSLDIEVAGAAAGTRFASLIVTNEGASACTIAGFPGVSLVTGSGELLGDPADRNPAIGAIAVTLEPGESAHAMAGFPNNENFAPGICAGPSARLVLYPPEETAALQADFEEHACTGFSVRVFEPGRNEAGR